MELDMGSIIALVIMCAGAFAAQLFWCFRAKRILTRLAPVLILLGIEIICVIVIFVAGSESDAGTVFSLTALAQMVLCGLLLVPAELAWLVYGIIWFANKKKNKPEVYG